MLLRYDYILPTSERKEYVSINYRIESEGVMNLQIFQSIKWRKRHENAWRKLNNRLQEIIRNPNLHPDERSAGERIMVRDKDLVGYAALYPLPIIIALSFLLDSTEAHFFRKYITHELQRPSTTITPIFLFGGTQH